MGRPGDFTAGVRAAAAAPGEHGESAEKQKFLDPAATPRQQWRSSQGTPIRWGLPEETVCRGTWLRDLVQLKERESDGWERKMKK